MCYLLDLHLFLGRPFSPVLETPKSDDDTDGLFGIVPQLLLEEELGQLTSWYTSSIDVVRKNLKHKLFRYAYNTTLGYCVLMYFYSVYDVR